MCIRDRAYNVTCNHRRFVHSVTVGHPGARNDKTISTLDDFLTAVRSDPLYTDAQYELVDKDGQWYLMAGVWILCDGGYHRWKVMQCPLKAERLSDESERAFSRRAESVRKDVECLFGILKGRWRLLKLPMLYHGNNSRKKCDNVFMTCCMLHNILLQHDGLMDWEAEVDWSQADGLWDESTDYADVPELDLNREEFQERDKWAAEGEVDLSELHSWQALREKLVTHFAHPVAKAGMQWNTLHMV
eukprot:TRINITY_DN14344_c0_g1_i1.p1 TRINITY_DN14344_c0_g1~~TRINITY_DN14344_c0_g1_i1.p1  ORF type:complete len:245 (-),score=52.71 TRINITY_DN14344_c0_g1_i1:36-770(-)